MITRQKRRFLDANNVQIETPTATISPLSVERLLGAQVHQDMCWVEHALDIEDSLIKALNVRQVASFKTRKTVASGIFMSKLMPLLSVCEEHLVKALQVVQNKAARSVARLDIFTPTQTLMRVCGWMSVRQLLVYHSLVLFHKTLKNKSPVYLHKKITAGGRYPYKRKQAARCPPGFFFEVLHPTASGAVRPEQGSRLGLSRHGWCLRSTELYNTLPTDLRLEIKIPYFKKRLKE